MKTERFRFACILILVLAICLICAGCGDREKAAETDPQATSTPEPVTEISSPDAAATPAPEGQEGTVSQEIPATQGTTDPAPVEVTPVPAPETPKPPTTVELQYNGSAVTSLSFQSSAVFQLHAVTNDGSTGGTWTSSDASAASVDENGVVTCWKAGSPKITYTVNDASSSVTLNITEPTVHIYFGGVEKTDITLNSIWGYEIQLVEIVTPLGSEVTWSSDNSDVASVSENGYVTARKMGSALITCKCGTASASCWIRVTDNPPAYLAPTPDPNDGTPRIVITYAGVANSDFTMTVGMALDMDYVLYNIDPSKAKVVWSVQDPAYASVDQDGVIVAKKSTWGIAPLRNYTILKATCGDYSFESYVFIKKENP